MPVRAECKPHSPDLKRGALATDARGCSLWRSLLERPPPAPESRVRDPLGELVRTRVGGGYTRKKKAALPIFWKRRILVYLNHFVKPCTMLLLFLFFLNATFVFINVYINSEYKGYFNVSLLLLRDKFHIHQIWMSLSLHFSGSCHVFIYYKYTLSGYICF